MAKTIVSPLLLLLVLLVHDDEEDRAIVIHKLGGEGRRLSMDCEAAN